MLQKLNSKCRASQKLNADSSCDEACEDEKPSDVFAAARIAVRLANEPSSQLMTGLEVARDAANLFEAARDMTESGTGATAALSRIKTILQRYGATAVKLSDRDGLFMVTARRGYSDHFHIA